jgi:HEAT repeat protein
MGDAATMVRFPLSLTPAGLVCNAFLSRIIVVNASVDNAKRDFVPACPIGLSTGRKSRRYGSLGRAAGRVRQRRSRSASLEISVTEGPKTTFDVLSATRNRAVLPALAAALRSSSASIRAEAIRAIVRRRDGDSHQLLLRQFEKFHADERAILCQAHGAMPHHMAGALKAAVLGGDAARRENACQIIALCRDYDLFPALVDAAERRQHPGTAAAVASLMRLADCLDAELAAWLADRADGKPLGRDPTFPRRHMLAALERSLANYARHECRELIDAFLLLAPSDNAMLQKILHDDPHPCHRPITDALATSTTPGMIARLARLLCDTDAPAAVLQTIAGRTDAEFLRALFAQLKRPVPLRVLHNMKRLNSVAWLEGNATPLLDLSGAAQAVAVELAAASGITAEALFKLLALMLEKGLAEARRASCQALAKFDRPEADDLVLRALNDPDDGVRAAAIRQLRARNLPDALKTLVSLLDNRSMEVRDAARSSLAEFNFVRYRAMFDLLDASAARITGQLVHKVDAAARDGLMEELTSPTVSSRLRGIEMALAMDAAQDVCDQLIALSRSENPALRREAVAALGRCAGAKVEVAIQSALKDSHQSVRDAAADAAAQLRSSGCAAPIHVAAVGGVAT